MNIIKHELWATPVWEIETGFDAKFNNDLLREVSAIKPAEHSHELNIWDTQTPTIQFLKNKIETIIREQARPYYPDFIHFNLNMNRAWLNRQEPGDSLPLHDHGGNALAVTYYIKAPDNCGDLLLVDPRGSINWDWKREGTYTSVKATRIKPKAGNLVFFPGFIIHMVEFNKSKETRISLTSNIVNIKK